MKKLVAISLLLVLMSTAAFAQFKVGFTADTLVDLLYIEKDTGDNFKGKGVSNFLSSSLWDSSELRLTFGYTGENFEAFLEIKGDSLINTRGNGLFQPGDSDDSFFDLLALYFGDFYVKGTAGIFSGYVGNTANRGKTDPFRYAVFSDYLHNNFDKFGYFGTDLKGVDVNNLNQGAPYASLGLNIAPLTIEVASDLGTRELTNPKASADRIAATLRVSGDKVADLISFDVIYSIIGEDTNNQARANPPNGGKWVNKFGLYAGLGLEDLGLGFAAGFSGGVNVYEKGGTSTTAVDIISPFFAGIDLHVQFTGVDKLTVSFNNNLSFSGAKGKTSTTERVFNLTEDNYLGNNQEQGWFALYNALGLSYALTEKLSANLQIANLLGVLSFKDSTAGASTKERTTTSDKFYITAFTTYAFNANVSLEGGIGFGIDGQTVEAVSPAATTTNEGGTLYFGIPLRFKVTF